TASVTVTLAYGELRQDADIQAARAASLAGLIFYDDNLTGVREANEYGAEGRAFTLWQGDTQVASAETDSNGAFLFSQLAPGEYTLRVQLEDNEVVVSGAQKEGNEWVAPVTLADGARMHGFALPVMRYAAISGQVWSLDGSDNGVSGIPVSLYDQSGRMLAAVTADTDGSFGFEGLLPGSYLLSATLPEGYLFSRAQESLSGRSSYIISAENGQSQSVAFTVTMGEDLTGVDIGIGAIGAIGDRAWLDENENGMQDLGEPDMPGIQIALYQQGQLIASTESDAYGHWELTGLFPGEYEMQVTMHAELKATVHQEEFPLVASIMTESEETVVRFTVVVPSGTENLHCDLGFRLRTPGAYPAAMNDIPEMDWTPYSQRK
ncbi:MAG: SdrD B-like domain-containing protein, partial [Eubacteriales bacterium]|nr:SdrD B-like domain-containing protein [Eubacteriales bacterium]